MVSSFSTEEGIHFGVAEPAFGEGGAIGVFCPNMTCRQSGAVLFGLTHKDWIYLGVVRLPNATNSSGATSFLTPFTSIEFASNYPHATVLALEELVSNVGQFYTSTKPRKKRLGWECLWRLGELRFWREDAQRGDLQELKEVGRGK
jgi:hypothetical protein